ncbi:MAG: amidohydrolase family protein, partial [Actinobacteria bacterium]|nr:amidohydrolase family protein [Actinomycetota bacterium]
MSARPPRSAGGGGRVPFTRPVLPLLLAISANSPFLDARDAGLHSARTQIFTKSFPRCGIPDSFGDWATYASYIEFLVRTNSIVEHTQLWWSVRPHHAFGTVEVRICDAQSSAEESSALAALVAACVGQAALDYDDGLRPEPPPGRLIEENLWRAIRFGLDGRLLDLEAPRIDEFEAAEVLERVRRHRGGPDAVVLGNGWDDFGWTPRRLPTAQELRDAADGRAVLLSRVDAHSCLVDAGTLTQLPLEHLEGVERDAQGQPTGWLREDASEAALTLVRGMLTPDDLHAARLAACAAALELGIASIHEMGHPGLSGIDDAIAWD